MLCYWVGTIDLSGYVVKVAVHFHLVPRLRSLALYLRFPVCNDVVVPE
jgi:hypothetical protein